LPDDPLREQALSARTSRKRGKRGKRGERGEERGERGEERGERGEERGERKEERGERRERPDCLLFGRFFTLSSLLFPLSSFLFISYGTTGAALAASLASTRRPMTQAVAPL
jgi:hypothetical protein